jgi:rhodanese-related sulfurtransferase
MQRGIPEIAVTEVDALLAGGAALLDVREGYEWDAGHAPNASHLPMGELSLQALPEGRPLLVVCHVGGRSAAATQALVRAGVDAANVAGGMEAWRRAGLPVVTDSGEPGRVA